MSGKSSTRRKNLGFKPLGVDPTHDTVYAVLEALPRGAASDFVVMAVSEYLANHAGETIEGKQRRKYIVLGAETPTPGTTPTKKKQTPPANEPPDESTNIGTSTEEISEPIEQAPHDAQPQMTALTQAHHEDSHNENDDESADAPPAPAHTKLDSEILRKLVFGFPSSD